ncbi:hypothetical protein C8T65DRAFT_592366 [Cerioporus squamosus]|nr:hypothetical protein C8T65DRAFT_592366 [Cerioporus squamosus]
MEDWTSVLYAFFKPIPKIEYVNGRCTHAFKCLAQPCKVQKSKGYAWRFLNKGDRTSTSGLKRHAEKCFGVDVMRAAMEVGDIKGVREQIVDPIRKSRPGTITMHFQCKKGQVSYMHHNHTRDCGFLVLMKTGCPGYHIPSPLTVSRDVKTVFARTRSCITKMLREYDGKLHFATDAWTSPNHRVFIAVTVHLEYQGAPLCLVLDVVEVAASHTGDHLAVVFAGILKEFGIEEKVSPVCDIVCTVWDLRGLLGACARMRQRVE